MPSLHFGYALLVGAAVYVLARGRWVRMLGAAYPPFMLFTIVATGDNKLIMSAAITGLHGPDGNLVVRPHHRDEITALHLRHRPLRHEQRILLRLQQRAARPLSTGTHSSPPAHPNDEGRPQAPLAQPVRPAT